MILRIYEFFMAIAANPIFFFSFLKISWTNPIIMVDMGMGTGISVNSAERQKSNIARRCNSDPDKGRQGND